ncbi:MAG: polysaccharide biosynthesis C-terminal domain-containing protein [Tannerella sp.]|jgi:O-antigen/teichoic acid export membrane protein|nr:polysaccharide biosynthesis C-terminal domain-containing protein [Tannerella sp.]
MEQGRNKKLINDILIYGAGAIGAKFITYFLYPIYTFFIAPDDLGYYDITLTAVFFLMPAINLQLRSGVFRFLIDNKDENSRKAVINQSYRMMIAATAVVSVLFVIIPFFADIRCYSYIFGLLLSMSFYEVQIQIVRGLGHTKLYVVCGILSASFIFLFGILFVVFLKWNIEGIFLAYIIAQLLVICFIEIKLSVIRKYFSLKTKNKDVTKELLKYCGPLIIVSSFIWITSYSYRYFITYNMGLYANGLFAAAFKFATIIEIIAMTVFQAWQEMSVLQFNAKDKDKYYSSVLNSYLLFLTSAVITLSFILKSFYGKFVEVEYGSSVIYLYALCIAEIGYALQAFMSAIFHAQKNTMQILYVTLASAVVSLFSYYVFIKYMGLMGAAVGFGISFFFMFAYYMILIRKSIKISFSAKHLITSVIILVGGGFIFYATENVWWRIIYWMISIITLYRTLPKSILHEAKTRIAGKLSDFRK